MITVLFPRIRCIGWAPGALDTFESASLSPLTPQHIASSVAFPPTHPALARALADRAYADPTAVQTAVLAPEALARDILVSAQTGSGKTVAFGLAFAPDLLGEAETLGRAGDPLALVIAPTRELALQVHRELSWLYQHAGGRVVACVGGMDPRSERRQLAAGCHIVVGTPGRLRDHLERQGLKGAGLKVVVLDEADEMLDLGFREDLEFILQATPKERRTLMLSATLPKGIVALAKNFQRDAFRVEVSSGTAGHADIEYRAMRIAAHDTEHAVVNVLRYFESPGALVFCNTRDSVRHLNAILQERGFMVVALSGELSQSERNFALQALRDGKARVCVATDVAARGIDLPSLGLVIHADLPHDADTLQHRSGRTGRAGRKGTSVMLIPPSRRKHAERLLSATRIRANWCGLPTADDIRKLDRERLLQTMLSDAAQQDDGQDDDLAMARDLMTKVSAEDIARAFVRGYRARLPAAEDVAVVASSGPSENKRDHSSHRAPDQRSDAAHEPFKPSFTTPDATVWFKLNVGRQDKADPKWLIPEICRQGAVAKRHLGAIRILDRETRFEVDQKVAANFAELVSKITKGQFRIEPSEAPSAGASSSRKQYESKPHESKSHELKSHESKSHQAKPWQSKPWQPKVGQAKTGQLKAGQPSGGAKERDYGPKRDKPRWTKKPGGKPWAGPHGKAKAKPLGG